MKKIAVLAGDGIGPEVMQEAIKVLDVVQKNWMSIALLNQNLDMTLLCEKKQRNGKKNLWLTIEWIHCFRMKQQRFKKKTLKIVIYC